MDQDDVIILDEGKYQPPEPVKLPEPTEPADLGSMLACGDRDIYDEDAPPSLYTLSQIVEDANVPTQQVPEVSCSPRTEEALQPTNIGDWSSECEPNAPWDDGSEGRKSDRRTLVSLLSLQSLFPWVRGAPDRSLSSGPSSQSLVRREFRSLSRRLSTEPATRTPWTPPLVAAPNHKM